jgi:PAS domain-containing protein
MGMNFEMLRNEMIDPAGPAAGAMEFCTHPVLVTDMEGGLFRANSALGLELGCTREEVLAMGTAHRFLKPQKDQDGMVRRFNVDGRISIPSILTRMDGSTQNVMCYIVHTSEGDEPLTLTIVHPGR